MKKLLALLTAAVATLTSAWAATPVAVWEDLSVSGDALTKNGVTLNPNLSESGNVISGTSVKVVDKPIVLTLGTSVQSVKQTVIVKYSGISSNPSAESSIVTFTTNDAGNDYIGVCVNTEGDVYGSLSGVHWNNGANVTSGKIPLEGDSHRLGARFKMSANTDPTFRGTFASVDGATKYSVGGLVGANQTIKGIAIGGGYLSGTNGKLPVMSGMIVEKVAVFNEALSEYEIASYEFPSEITPVDYTKWGSNPAVLTWAGTGDFHNGPWNIFDLETKTDGDQLTKTNIPGHEGENIDPIWKTFCVGSGYYGYVAPGYVLRLTSAHKGNLNAAYNNLAFGGIIVEPGAVGYTINADASKFAGTANANRPTDIGNLGTAAEVKDLVSYFDINEDLTISRDGVFKIHGPVVIDVAGGKVLDLNSARTGAYADPVLQVGAKLSMLGKGSLKVHGLDASGDVTLDFGTQSVSRTAPYITGAVKIGASTKFILPADYTVGSVYAIATSIDSSSAVGTTYTTSVTVGETTYENAKIIVGSNGAISAFYGSDYNPAAGMLCMYDWTFTGTLTSKGVYTNTLNWDTNYSASNGYVTGDTFTYGKALDARATPYVPDGWSISYPTEWTCFVAGVAPSNVGGGLIVFGTTNGGAIGLVTTAADEVSLVRTAGNSKYQVLAKMAVPGAQTTSHAYTFVKTASTITVYLDGSLWNVTEVANASFGNKLQVGSIHGGTSNTGIVKATSGSIQAVRIMNGVQPAATIRAFSNEFPYHSANGTYGRTFAAGSVDWVAEGAWSSTKDEGNIDAPGAGIVKADFSGETAVSVNLAAETTYESLTINNNEEGSITFTKATDGVGAIKAGQIFVNAPIIVGENAIDLSYGPITVGDTGLVTFDFSGLPYVGVVTDYPFVQKVTGVLDQTDSKFALKKPAENDNFDLTLSYNETAKAYEVKAVYKQMVSLAIPAIANTTRTVTMNGKTVEIDADGNISVPKTAAITITYAPATGYHLGETTTVTIDGVTSESTVDVTGITATHNKYTVQVMHVENATTYVSIGGGEFEVVTEASIQVEHGKSYSAKYVAKEGYMLVLPEGDTEPFKTEGYNYGSVTFNTADYPVHCAAVKIAAKIGDTPYATIQAAIEALVDGETTLADITVVDKTATLPEGYEDYTIDEDGKIVLAKTPAQKFVEEVATAEDGATIKVLESITLDAKLEISGKEITIDADSAVTITGQLRAVNGATLTIGANVTVTSDKHPTLFILGDPAVKTAGTKKTTVIVNGSILNTNEKFDETYAISGNGTDTQGVDLTINGTVCNSNGTAIYWPNKGSLVVNVGSTITGAAYGIYAKSGSVTIKGGTITSTATEIVDPSVNNNGTSGKGYALVLEKLKPGEGGYADNLTADVSGGTFEAPTAILSWARTDSERLTKFVADGVTLTETTPSAADIKKSYSSDLPGAEEVPADQKDAYNTWAAENGVTSETSAADATFAATAFVMGVTVGEGQTLAKAAEAKANEILKDVTTAEGVDLAALLATVGEDGLVVTTENTNLTVKLVPTTLGEGVETSAKLFKLSITIKK